MVFWPVDQAYLLVDTKELSGKDKYLWEIMEVNEKRTGKGKKDYPRQQNRRS